jgi:hypothetical protein
MRGIGGPAKTAAADSKVKASASKQRFATNERRQDDKRMISVPPRGGFGFKEGCGQPPGIVKLIFGGP